MIDLYKFIKTKFFIFIVKIDASDINMLKPNMEMYKTSTTVHVFKQFTGKYVHSIMKGQASKFTPVKQKPFIMRKTN